MGYGANTVESRPRLDLRVRDGEVEAAENRLPESELLQTGFCQKKGPVLQKSDWY